MSSGLFTTVQVRVPRNNPFSRSYEFDFTTDFGKLVPVVCEEVYPSDDYRIRTEAVIKLAELQAPAYARIDAYIHYFFVPNRLLYEDWEEFITGGLDGNFSNGTMLSPVAPCADINDLANGGWLDPGSLGDYFGMPSLAHGQGQTYANVPPISILPFLAYQKVYSDFFRDELLTTVPEFAPHAGGQAQSTDLADFMTMRYRSWKKDYFTSARPDTQLGPQQEIPLNGSIASDGVLRFGFSSDSAAARFFRPGLATSDFEDLGSDHTSDRYVSKVYASQSSGSGNGYQAVYVGGLTLDDAGILINDLRRTLKLQEWSEKNMRGGNRYIENILHHFGVKSSDARLQRSQYLGGRKIPVMISEVLQTTGTVGNQDYSSGTTRYLGARGGVGSSASSTQRIHYFSEEHGFLIGILSIMPHALYCQGIPRMFGDRWDRYSYLWPEFGNLGEQDVYNWELFVGAGANQPNNETFGYQSRYADLKVGVNRIAGEFKTNLQYWTTARIFSSRPNLNESFVTMTDSNNADGMNKIFAVDSNALASHFRCQFFNKISVLRKLPKFGVPSI